MAERSEAKMELASKESRAEGERLETIKISVAQQHRNGAYSKYQSHERSEGMQTTA